VFVTHARRVALAGTAFAQVPTANDRSDKNANTGSGTDAPGGPAATNGGSDNTASGYSALGDDAPVYSNQCRPRKPPSSTTKVE